MTAKPTFENAETASAGVASLTESNWLDAVRAQVNSLRFGVVQIVVHDSKVVQIERTEKIRLDGGRQK